MPVKTFTTKNEIERQKAEEDLCASKTFMFDLFTIKSSGLSVVLAAGTMLNIRAQCLAHGNDRFMAFTRMLIHVN